MHMLSFAIASELAGKRDKKIIKGMRWMHQLATFLQLAGRWRIKERGKECQIRFVLNCLSWDPQSHAPWNLWKELDIAEEEN